MIKDEHKAEHLDAVRFFLDDAVRYEDLVRYDWRRQTDVLQEVFIVAAMFADIGSRTVLVDGHINQEVKRDAVDSGNVKGFFNRRAHDAGLKGRRLIVYDTTTTRAMGGRGKGAARLHFHGAFEVPKGMSRAAFIGRLEGVYGRAAIMGQRQFHVSEPTFEEHYTLSEVQACGPIGKLFYALKGAGSAYVSLGHNEDGRRSRRAPLSRGGCNSGAGRLAKGNASHFNRAVVFVDAASKRAGQAAFEEWLRAEREMRRPTSMRSSWIKPNYDALSGMPA